MFRIPINILRIQRFLKMNKKIKNCTFFNDFYNKFFTFKS